MKTPTPAKKKPAREPHVPYVPTSYSPGALALTEKATGQRLTQLPAPKPPAQAVDSE